MASDLSLKWSLLAESILAVYITQGVSFFRYCEQYHCCTALAFCSYGQNTQLKKKTFCILKIIWCRAVIIFFNVTREFGKLIDQEHDNALYKKCSCKTENTLMCHIMTFLSMTDCIQDGVS